MRTSHWLQIFRSVACVFALVAASAWAGQGYVDPAPVHADGASTQAMSLERAVEIALEQAGGGTVVSSEHKVRKDGRARYAVLVIDGDERVKVVVDGATGQVMSLRRRAVDSVDYPRGWTSQAPSGDGAGIGSARAREIALERAGGGTVVDLEQEFKKDGRIVFEIEVVSAGRKCEVKIDGRSGAVIEYKEKTPRHLR